jgi:hypothetical protein
MATFKEKSYQDRDIEVRGETVRLSELTKEQRDLFFAGVDDGFNDGKNFACYIMLGVIVLITVAVLILK